jgi:nitrogen fixation/metabolism regulation signal transduction histidine kinase
MDLYTQRNWWGRILIAGAMVIVIFSAIYMSRLTHEISQLEIAKVEQLAAAYKTINVGDETELRQALEEIRSNENIPVILTDEELNVISHKNYNLERVKNENKFFISEISKAQKRNNFIILEMFEDQYQYIFYKDSDLLKKLKIFPAIQLGIISIFILVFFLTFAAFRNAEQNRVWVGMAKETAHQLGTPISSLSGWIEIIKDSEEDFIKNEIVEEMYKDLDRLELVADRFSKIGSPPTLAPIDIAETIHKIILYMEKRVPKNVSITFANNLQNNKIIESNISLIGWVMENLIKNAIDALEGKGSIQVILSENKTSIFIDVTDSGKGIPKHMQSRIFNPGFSTKKRGWGLGLALSKRIIEKYHDGLIFVKDSAPDKGSTFRIQLNKA